MAKFYGPIGYALDTVESSPGVWTDNIVEHMHRGEMTRNFGKFQNANQVHDELTISNMLSIVADPFAKANFHTMRYVRYLGAKWKITSVEVQYPRLILTIGGVYNGE